MGSPLACVGDSRGFPPVPRVWVTVVASHLHMLKESKLHRSKVKCQVSTRGPNPAPVRSLTLGGCSPWGGLGQVLGECHPGPGTEGCVWHRPRAGSTERARHQLRGSEIRHGAELRLLTESSGRRAEQGARAARRATAATLAPAGKRMGTAVENPSFLNAEQTVCAPCPGPPACCCPLSAATQVGS